MSNNNKQSAMQRSIDNNADIYSNMQSVMVNHAQSRPNNTTIAYEERQKSFKKWCIETKKFDDGIIVTEGKLLLFFFFENRGYSQRQEEAKDQQWHCGPFRERIYSGLCQGNDRPLSKPSCSQA
ncbi:unnamed protein product [Rhizopus stolonifer]